MGCLYSWGANKCMLYAYSCSGNGLVVTYFKPRCSSADTCPIFVAILEPQTQLATDRYQPPPKHFKPTDLIPRYVLDMSYQDTLVEVASSPGHSQILSRSRGEKSIFLHACEIKSGSGLGTRL